MKSLLLIAMTAGVWLGTEQPAGLKIVVIAGEDAVNVIQQRTAVAPIIEVRDRNNVPVAGVPVTFTVGGSGASFAGGVNTLTVTTNALGQATASGLTPTATGALRVTASAVLQGQTATATIAQTNVMTAAQAAAASGGTSSTAGTGAAAAGGGGGLSVTTIGIIGAVAAGGAVAATQTGILGGSKEFISISGVVFATATFGGPGGVGGGTTFGPPVVGATVSTSLDSATTTTDSSGRFLLHTNTEHTKDDGCRVYTITITAPGLPTYSVTGAHGTGTASDNQLYKQQYALSPPTPSSVGCNGL